MHCYLLTVWLDCLHGKYEVGGPVIYTDRMEDYAEDVPRTLYFCILTIQQVIKKFIA